MYSHFALTLNNKFITLNSYERLEKCQLVTDFLKQFFSVR